MHGNEDSGDASQILEWIGPDVSPPPSVRESSPPPVMHGPFESTRYLIDLIRDLRTLESVQLNHPRKFHNTYALLAGEIDRVWTNIYMRVLLDEQVYYSQHEMRSGMFITMQEKILIPNIPNNKYIGRILGPRGISVKQLEAQTGCRILIRGRGSVKDPAREERLRNRPGWEHLEEPLHVLVSATDFIHEHCAQKLSLGVHCIKHLLSSNNDEHKRLQLVQLAIINGTYRPMRD